LERAVLWVAFYELSLSPRTVSSAIIIDEALEVLQELSDQRSKALINGLLDRFAKSLETPKKSNDQ
jgi:transcription termination factor NusB